MLCLNSYLTLLGSKPITYIQALRLRDMIHIQGNSWLTVDNHSSNTILNLSGISFLIFNSTAGVIVCRYSINLIYEIESTFMQRVTVPFQKQEAGRWAVTIKRINPNSFIQFLVQIFSPEPFRFRCVDMMWEKKVWKSFPSSYCNLLISIWH